MHLVIVSNFFNHHQKPLSDVFYHILGDDFCFIATSLMPTEHKKMGYPEYETPYLKFSYTSTTSYEICKKIVDNADVVIFGSAPFDLIKNRLIEKKIVFCYSERLFKKNDSFIEVLPRFVKWNWVLRHRKNVFLLCASAYAAKDYAKIGLFRNKTYKWGYFPEVKKFDDLNSLFSLKKKASILWAGRLISWKHPDLAIKVAKKLKENGFLFDLNIIGDGPCFGFLKSMINAYDLKSSVHLLGAKSMLDVREYMEKSEIFLFTSDRNEGWGAVLNESMNSACAVVANKAIGSVPFLIKNLKNGLVYEKEDDLYEAVSMLLNNELVRIDLAREAYQTMVDVWNPEFVADRFFKLCNSLLNNKDVLAFKWDGPCEKYE